MNLNFNTIKEVEDKLKTVTDIKVLHGDITFKSQGEIHTCKFIGSGSAAGSKELVWLADIGASQVRIVYTGENHNITVTEVKVTKR